MAAKQSTIPFGELIATRSLAPFHAWILGGVVILYIATFPSFQSPLLVSVPAAIAGWFYSRRGGVIASILAVVLNLALMHWLIAPISWSTLFDLRNGFLIGHLFVAIVSIMIGYFREVFENIFQLEKRLRSQERFLSLSNMIVKKIMAPSKPDRLFDDIVNHLTNLFVADHGYITRWDPFQRKSVLIATTNSVEGSVPGIELSIYGTKIMEQVLETGQVLFIENTLDMPALIGHSGLTDSPHPVRAFICLPFVAREYKFGMALLAYESQKHYTDEEKAFAERIGYQIALALWTVRQDEVGLQQLDKTRTLMQIGQTLGETERVGLDVVLQLIVDSARKLIPQADKTVIWWIKTISR
jgi:hypothetical protein